MEKKEFFREPGARTILEGKTRKIKTGNLVTIIEKLRKNDVYVIDHNIIPITSPNGIYSVFTRFRFLGDASQLYLTKLADIVDETKWTQLTFDGANSYPAWRPKQ